MDHPLLTKPSFVTTRPLQPITKTSGHAPKSQPASLRSASYSASRPPVAPQISHFLGGPFGVSASLIPTNRPGAEGDGATSSGSSGMQSFVLGATGVITATAGAGADDDGGGGPRRTAASGRRRGGPGSRSHGRSEMVVLHHVAGLPDSLQLVAPAAAAAPLMQTAPSAGDGDADAATAGTAGGEEPEQPAVRAVAAAAAAAAACQDELHASLAAHSQDIWGQRAGDDQSGSHQHLRSKSRDKDGNTARARWVSFMRSKAATAAAAVVAAACGQRHHVRGAVGGGGIVVTTTLPAGPAVAAAAASRSSGDDDNSRVLLALRDQQRRLQQAGSRAAADERATSIQSTQRQQHERPQRQQQQQQQPQGYSRQQRLPSGADEDPAADPQDLSSLGLFVGGHLDELLRRLQQLGAAADGHHQAPPQQQQQNHHGRPAAGGGRGGAEKDADAGAAAAPPPQLAVRVYHGVCAWSAGQLEGELAFGVWGLVSQAAVEDVAGTEWGRVWQELTDSDRPQWL
jgi:hypothetical protein